MYYDESNDCYYDDDGNQWSYNAGLYEQAKELFSALSRAQQRELLNELGIKTHD